MGQADYPTGTNLQAWLLATGLFANIDVDPFARIDCDQHMRSAITWFEGQVGRKMLASTGTRRFDVPTGPRNILALDADLVSCTSLTVAGVAKTEGVDFWLLPDNANQDGKPFDAIEFALSFAFSNLQRKSILITGTWGFGLTIPDDAWEGMVAQGAFLAYPQIAINISKGTQMRREGDVEEQYGRGQKTGPLVEEAAAWQMQAGAAVGNYLRVESWLA